MRVPCRSPHFIWAAARRAISRGETSSLCVAIHQWLPTGSFTAALRSPQNWSAGSMSGAAPAANVRLNVASVSLMYRYSVLGGWRAGSRLAHHNDRVADANLG